MKLDWQTGIFVYIGVTFAFFILVTLYEAWRDSVMDWCIPSAQLCRCSDCGLVFIVPRCEVVGPCPRCRKISMIRRKG